MTGPVGVIAERGHRHPWRQEMDFQGSGFLTAKAGMVITHHTESLIKC